MATVRFARRWRARRIGSWACRTALWTGAAGQSPNERGSRTRSWRLRSAPAAWRLLESSQSRSTSSARGPGRRQRGRRTTERLGDAHPAEPSRRSRPPTGKFAGAHGTPHTRKCGRCLDNSCSAAPASALAPSLGGSRRHASRALQPPAERLRRLGRCTDNVYRFGVITAWHEAQRGQVILVIARDGSDHRLLQVRVT
jgi:hypothetical protein